MTHVERTKRPSFISRLLGSAAVLAAFAALSGASAQSISIPGEKVFPEGITATSDGTVYIGSLSGGQVFKATAGGAATPFILKEPNGLHAVLGVLADEASGTLWVCSSTLGGDNPPPADLKGFDLKSGAAKTSFALPAGSPLCNDIAIGADGTVYATSTSDGKIFAAKKGATALTEWKSDAQFAGGLDGLAILDGKMYVNDVAKGTLFSIAIGAGGEAGPVTPVKTSRPLQGPDGMRTAAKSGIWLAENGAGRISHIAIDGDTATVTTVKEGLEAPTAIAQVGDTLWYNQAKFAYLFGDKKGQDPGAFTIDSVSAGGM